MKSKLFPMFRVSAIALASALSVTTACASPISWDGSDSTAWALEANWAGDVAPADDLTSDIAVFNLASYTAPVFAPNAGTRSIGGIIIGDDTTSTGSLTLAGTMLSVGGSGIDMRANAGVTTISSPVTLGAAQTWQNASSNLLTVSSAVTGGNLLTVGGAGDTTISGVISGTGALVKEGAGTLTLGSTANTYSGGTTVNNGTFNISGAGTSGIGCINGTLTINSATTVNATDWALGYDSTAGRYVHTINIIGGTLNKINSGGSGTSAQTINMTGGAITGAVVDLYNLATANSDIAFNTNASATTATVSAGLNLRMENGGGAGGTLTFTVADGEAATDLLISGNITFGGTASTQRITKADAGTLVLSGANTYGGATTISGGTLEIGGSGKLGNGSYAGAITNNASLVYSSTSAQTLSGVISGTGTLTKSGNSTLTLTNIDTYSGNTTINEGSLVLSGSGKLANSPVIDVATGATLQGGVFGTGQTVRGTGTLAGTVTLGAGAALSPAGDAAIGTMPVTGAVSLGGTVSMQIQKTGGVVSGDQFTGAGAITYGGALVVTATGETLDVGDSIQLFANTGGRSNTFTSITLPTLPDGLSWSSGNLSATGTLTVTNSLSIPVFSPAGGAFAGAQSVTISSDPGTTLYYTMDGNEPTGSSPNADSPVTNLAVPVGTTTIKAFARKTGFSDTPVVTSTYTIYSSAQWNVDNSGNWSDAGNWLNSAIPSGPGVLVDFFSFAQSASTTVTVDSNRTVGAITFGNINPIDWTVDASNAAVLTLAGSSNPVIAVNGTDMAATISAPLAGGQGLTKSGAGKLTLSGTNTYTGATTLNGGILSIGAAPHLPSGSALTLSGGSILNVTGTMTLANNVTIASGQSGVIRAGGTGYATLTGNYSNVAGTLDLDLSAAGRIDINSANGPGVGSTVRVSDATASGTSYMAMNNTNAQNFHTDAKVIFNDSGAATTTIYLGNHAGKNVKFGALDGGNATTRITSDNSANTVTITGTADGNFAGVISNVNSGTITLVKTGSATQMLSGVNTYTGTTTVNAGTLVAANTSGSATGTGAVTVKPAATLAGTGSIGGAATIEDGGFVAPGVSGIGTLTVASATMSGTYQCDLGASTSDLLAVTGTLTVDGTTSIAFSGTPAANSYTIASYGTLSGTLPAITPPSGYSLVDDSANKQIKLVRMAAGYDSWMAAWVTAGFTGDIAVGADPDADGMKNLLEFVLNGNPGSSDTSILPVQQVTATDLVFSFTRRVDSATATTQVFEYGSNLAGWTPLDITGTPGEGVVIGTPTGTAPNQVQTVTITIPRSAEGNGKLFGRLAVTQP